MVEFISLSEVEKDEEIANHGKYLDNYVEGDIMCDVYQLFAFYVKCCYNLTRNDKAQIIAYPAPGNGPMQHTQIFPFSGN